MKRVVVVLLIAIIIVSCNRSVDSENAPEQEKIEAVVDTFQIDESIDYSEIGFQLMEIETIGALKLEMKVEEVEKIAGKSHDVTEFEYWGADGYEHQSRFYQDSTIDIDFIKLENGNIVSNSIYIDNNSAFKTAQGIGVGSAKKEVMKAYEGKISSLSEENINVGTIYGGLLFSLKDGKVTSFFLGAGAE